MPTVVIRKCGYLKSGYSELQPQLVLDILCILFCTMNFNFDHLDLVVIC